MKKPKLNHVIWTHTHGNLPYIPKGFVILHIDGNPKNNTNNNLFLMPKEDYEKVQEFLNNQSELNNNAPS